MYLPEKEAAPRQASPSQHETLYSMASSGKAPTTTSSPALPNFLQFINDSNNNGSIAERAWMMNMASEMAKRYAEEREKGTFGTSREGSGSPPPAYAR
jgi:hypothetical protein